MRKCQFVSTILIIILICFNPLISSAYDLNANIEASVLWGRAYDVAVSGDYAYYCKHYGLEVVNISDPLNRSLTSRLFMESGANHIDISGQYAYIIGRRYTDGGLQIVDISNPNAPQIVGNLEIAGDLKGVLCDSDILYLWRTDPDGILLIDVSDPTSPSVISAMNTIYFPSELAKSGDFIYVTELTSGLQIFNVSNPAAPIWV
ncbi:MAG: hypothetical protein ABIE07_11670 [Candidatus Zixiibacteriota bacterium]